jgi:hypothetical protein
MTSYAQARAAVIALIPEFPGWDVFLDGIATGEHPPWIVVSLSENGRDHSEGLSTNSHRAVLDIRVVSTSETSIGGVCDKLTSSLDGARANQEVSPLSPDKDSGVYASDLMVADTSTPYLMRVLTWRTGWPA